LLQGQLIQSYSSPPSKPGSAEFTIQKRKQDLRLNKDSLSHSQKMLNRVQMLLTKALSYCFFLTRVPRGFVTGKAATASAAMGSFLCFPSLYKQP
jgi:hypothetical protein